MGTQKRIEQIEAVSNFLEALGYNVKTIKMMESIHITKKLLTVIDELPPKIKEMLQTPDADKIIDKF